MSTHYLIHTYIYTYIVKLVSRVRKTVCKSVCMYIPNICLSLITLPHTHPPPPFSNSLDNPYTYICIYIPAVGLELSRIREESSHDTLPNGLSILTTLNVNLKPYLCIYVYTYVCIINNIIIYGKRGLSGGYQRVIIRVNIT